MSRTKTFSDDEWIGLAHKVLSCEAAHHDLISALSGRVPVKILDKAIKISNQISSLKSDIEDEMFHQGGPRDTCILYPGRYEASPPKTKYTDGDNPLSTWISERMDVSAYDDQKSKIRAPKSEIYACYKNWALDKGYGEKECLGRTTFYRVLEENYRGAITSIIINGRRYYHGIKIREERPVISRKE